MPQESFNLSEPLTPNQVQTAHEIKDTPGSSDFYTPECTSNNSKVCTTCPLKRVTFQRIIHSTPLKTNKRASAPINSMFPAKYRRNMGVIFLLTKFQINLLSGTGEIHFDPEYPFYLFNLQLVLQNLKSLEIKQYPDNVPTSVTSALGLS